MLENRQRTINNLDLLSRNTAKNPDVLIIDSLTPQSHINKVSATANPKSGIGFYDFWGFRSVAVNSVYKLHFYNYICCFITSFE